MRRVLLFAFLSLMPAFLLGQSTVTGVVVDSLTQEPLPMATVYVNETTIGTTTDKDGCFQLEGVSFPAKVVFSFVGYEPKAMDLERNPGKLTIGLTPNIELPEIVVSGKKNRLDKVHLDYFKSMFLGDDRWGKHATIKNEDVLMFDRSFQTSYHTRKVSRSSFASEYLTNGVMEKHQESVDTAKVITSVFTAWAYEPLIIDMPLLGYELYVDLVKFTVEQVNNVTTCNLLGYFYYRPYEKLKKRHAQNIADNRQRAYWGSSQHFLRSFAQDRLAENGFILTEPETVTKGKKNISLYLPVDVNKHSSSAGDNMLNINGLKEKDLRIRYYHRSDGSPLNFKERGKGIHRYSESQITFLEEDCNFLKDGIIIDNNIRFTGDISKKRVGSSLPGDYCLPEDTARTFVTESTDYAHDMIKFVDNINQFNSLFPQEKVYLEFDNTAYFQGEDIWYKAYVTNATTLESAPSGVLYVDFLAPTGKLLLQQKLKIEAGQADGLIPLLNAGTQQTREKQGILAYPSGFYEIRAYTQNMLDFSPEAIFSRVIPVYTQPKYVGEYDRSRVENYHDNPLAKKTRGEIQIERWRILEDGIVIDFYPEGGHFVKGLPCRVAFKVSGRDGFGVDGALKVQSFWDSVHTVHDGMGSFVVTDPVSFLYADFFPSGSDKKIHTQLPETEPSGFSMISDMLSDSELQVNIWRTQDRIGEQTALAVTCRGQVLYFKEIKDIENSKLSIDCSDWPVGVCRITLFNKEGMILASRSIFHSSDMYVNPTITANTDSMSHQSCDKEVIEFKLTDEYGNPLRDRFCLSVRDAADYGGGMTDNLQTNLLLSSDLKGYIHDPAWYLDSNDSLHREALNVLTMVQGWERYDWQTMTGLKEFEEKHRVVEKLTMNGWILSHIKRDPVSDISIYAALMPKEDKTLFESFDYQTDSTGYFGFDLSDFYGKADFTLHVMSKKKDGESKYDTKKRIRFERADRPDPRPFLKQETDLNHNTLKVPDYETDFTNKGLTAEQRRKLGTMIDDVDIEEQSGKIRFIDYDTFTSFEAEEDAELELDQGEYTSTVGEYLMEKLGFMRDPGKGPEEGSDENAEDDYESLYLDGQYEPFFYVHNQVKMLEQKPFDRPMHIDMIDVRSILVYDKPMYPREFYDLIPFTVEWSRKHTGAFPPGMPSNRKNPEEKIFMIDFFYWVKLTWDKYYLVDIQIKNDSELLFYNEIRNLGRRTTTVKGFTPTVQFYSPQYPEGPIEGNIDARRTLYWNPNVITDNEGRARVEFYNNSFTRRFNIKATGITVSGVPYILNQIW